MLDTLVLYHQVATSVLVSGVETTENTNSQVISFGISNNSL